MRKLSSFDAVSAALLAAMGLLAGCGGDAAAGPTENEGGDGTAGLAKEAGDEAASGSEAGDEAAGNEAGANEAGLTDALDGGGGALGCSSHACVNPTAIIIGDADTGYDTCEGKDSFFNGGDVGYLRRRAVVACPSLLPRPSGGACVPLFGDGGGGTCNSDSDCSGYPNGHCERWSEDGGTPVSCQCLPGCIHDSDCKASEMCLCGSPVGMCVPASCASGASCGSGCECISSTPGGNCGPRFDCQTRADECSRGEDCADGGQICSEDNGKHTCQPANYCGVGRPFLVEGAARFARSVERSDWSAPNVTPDVRDVPPLVRARLAEYWTRVGLMEHASIAAFARFALQLLAVGAPSDLVRATHEAMGDETEHARLAFALAATYGGGNVGPGEIAIDGSLDGFHVDGMLATIVREGCIGETLAAIEALDALEDATDPAVRAALATIARDETKHAELAWRTVAWLLESGRVDRAKVRDEVARALAEAAPGVRSGNSAEEDADWRGFGVLTEARRGDLRRIALATVVEPCARALLASNAKQGGRGPRDGAGIGPSVATAERAAII